MSCFFNDVVLVLLNLSKSHLASLWLRTDRDAASSDQPVFADWLPAFLADSIVVLFVWGLQADHGFKPGIKFLIGLFCLLPSDFIRGIPVNAVFHEKTGINERAVNILRVGDETSQLFQFPVQFVEILYRRRGTKPLENLLHSMCQSGSILSSR